MLMITPDSLYGRIGALLSALIIVAVFIGLTLHHDVFAGRPRKDFFWYYTNLSNLLVMGYFSLVSPFLYAKSRFSRFIPLAEFSVTMSILLTNAVFHLVIFPGVKPQLRHVKGSGETRMLAANNLLVHYAVPWLTVLYYLLCAPGKHTLPLYAATLWLAFPLVYASVIFLHASTDRRIPGTDRCFPYPFMDVTLLGKRRVLLICSALCVLCALGSIAILCIIRALYAIFGGGRALFLVG